MTAAGLATRPAPGPLVSVIVPTFNHGAYIAAALESIFAQAHRPLEVVVVDDGSTDDTTARLAPYLDRILLVRQANAGPAAARNAGMVRAAGEFLAFLDADDLWHPDKLPRQLARFEARPELELSICRVENFWAGDPSEEAQRLRERKQPKVMTGVVVQTFVARRSTIERVGPFNPRFLFGEDVDWYVRATELRVVEERLLTVLGYRRLHAHNMTEAWPSVKNETMLQVARAAIDRHRRRATTGDGGCE